VLNISTTHSDHRNNMAVNKTPIYNISIFT